MSETIHPFDPADAAAIDELRAQLARGPKMRIVPATRAKFDEMTERTPMQDPMLSTDVVAEGARQYLAGADARDPRASPSFGDLSQLPPIWLCAGEDEVLLDPLRAFAAAVDAAGSRAELHIWQRMHQR